MQVGSAGSGSVQAAAMRAATTPPGVGGALKPVETAGGRSTVDVDTVFRVVHALGQELRGTLDGAEAARMSGPVGVDPKLIQRTIAAAKENHSALMEKGSHAADSLKGLLRDLEGALSGSEASNAHLKQIIDQHQRVLAERYGFTGHLLDRLA